MADILLLHSIRGLRDFERSAAKRLRAAMVYLLVVFVGLSRRIETISRAFNVAAVLGANTAALLYSAR
jgi:hypothetical protein